MGQPEGRGIEEIIVGRSDNAVTWKAAKGFWDGSCKGNGMIGCGVVIKGVDRDRWVTISKIVVLLKVGTAMAAEMMGVCVLTEILDLVFFGKCPCIQNIIRCIHTTIEKQLCGKL